MASETLEEKKTDEGDPAVGEKETSAEENKEKEASETVEKDVSEEEKDPKEVEGAEEGKESKEEGERSKKVKGSRKRSLTKGGAKSKKSGDESTPKKPKKTSLDSGEPVTPVERPVRERKSVERYSASSAEKTSTAKAFSIKKGRGTQLKDIPNVAFKLSKRKPDENLQMLHTILFGKKAKVHTLKRNINQFSGFVWVENEEKHRAKIKEKLDKYTKEKLMDFCYMLDIPIFKATVKKEELSVKLLEFLESPHATTEVSLADKEQKQKGKKRKRKATVDTKITSGEASRERSNKKLKQSPEVIKKGKHAPKPDEKDEEEDESAGTRNDSDEGDESDGAQKEESDQGESESGEEDDKTKEQMKSKRGSSRKNTKGSEAKAKDKPTPVKKGTPTKSVKSPAKPVKSSSRSALKKGDAADDRVSASPSKSKASEIKKKSKVEKSSPKSKSASTKDKTASKKQPSKSGTKVSAKEQGRGKAGKKGKVEPSREEMHASVADIVKEVDFNTATLSDIIRQLGTHFGMDLMHRKAEVKSIIEDVINNMTDEEEDEEDVDEKNTEEAEADTEDKGDEDNDA